MSRNIRMMICLCFFLLIMTAASSAQVPPGYNPNLNIPMPTPFVPNVSVPVPSVPNITVPTPKPVTIPTNSFPTPVAVQPSHDPIFDRPVTPIDFRDFTNVTKSTPTPRVGKEGYDAGMAFYEEGKFYSAWKAFTESQYGDWKDWAEKCPQPKPATGEVWHDRNQWEQTTELTIRVDQASTDMFFRVYKEDILISNLFISGSDEVTIMLPGNANYTIKDGIGKTWYGEKEAFGKEGTYETLTFDEKGTDRVFLETGYAYTISINVTERSGGTDVDSKSETWENFSE